MSSHGGGEFLFTPFIFLCQNMISPSSIPRIKISPPFSWQCVDLTLELFLFRLFAVKCSNCQLTIGEKAYVMKAGQQTYHTDCFNCSVCQRRLTKGDMFYQTKSGSLLCKTDHDALQHQQKPVTAGSSKEESASSYDNLTALQGGSGSGSGSSTSSTPDSTVPPGHGTGSASQTSNPSEAVSSGKQHTKSSE
jgi:hypothetical protein